jgi:glycosyltransferase involved in cell wall biosynthesis
MGSRSLPKISALMGAYNYGRYIGEAIESAMLQDYPEELLELVIVDDGSTDDTAAIVATYLERYPGRIRFIQQANAGATAATNRARAEATGDLIALLDADDVWTPDKTRKQVEVLQRRPELGMVFSQMRVIDSDGATLRHGYGHRQVGTTNDFARVLWENVAVQSSLLVEAELFDAIPAEIPYADWWVTMRAAQFKAIDYLREELVLYRWHGANLTGGVGGVKALREAQKGIAFQRWVIRNLPLEQLTERLTPFEMAFVWQGFENQALKGLQGLNSYFGKLVTVTDEDRATAADLAAQAQTALAAGDLRTGGSLLWRARAHDPHDFDLRVRFDEAVEAFQHAETLPDPLEGSTGFAVVVDAQFLLADDTHLTDYADAMRGVGSATLVIDASTMDPAQAAADLQGLVARTGLADDEQVAMIAVVGALEPSQRFRLLSNTDALYGPARPQGRDDVPFFTPASLGQLAALVQAARADDG